LDIMRRVAFVIDLDPVRDAGTSATNEQLAEARDLAPNTHRRSRPRGTFFFGADVTLLSVNTATPYSI